MTNNPMQLLMTALQRGADPRHLINQMARNNPQMAQAAKMISGKNGAELQQMALNMCREQGTTPEQVMKALGLR